MLVENGGTCRYPRSAMILAGGFATRLRSALSDRPKALAPVLGRPILAHLLDHLESSGIRRAILCTGHLGGQILCLFGERHGTLELIHSQEPQPVGTAGALRRAIGYLDASPVLVLNGDSSCQFDLATFYAWHRARGAAGSLWLSRTEDCGRYGRALLDTSGQVVGFAEKESGARGLVNAGIYLLGCELLDDIPDGRSVSLEHEMLPRWLSRGLFGYAGDGTLLDIGTAESLAGADETVRTQKLAAEGASDSRFRHVLLDRDGTVIVERSYLSDPAMIQLEKGAVEGLRALGEQGRKLIILTNQSGVSRGYFTAERLDEIHLALRDVLRAAGVEITAVYVCPHHPDDRCRCRKPEPAMALAASHKLGFRPSDCVVVGDKDCDVELGRRLRAPTILVTTGYGMSTLARPDFVVDDLAEAARVIAYIGRHGMPGSAHA